MRVLVIDDSALVLQMLTMIVEQAGHDVVGVETWDAATKAYADSPPAAVVTDLNLPVIEDPLAALQALGPAPIIIVSGRPQAELDAIATSRGLHGAVSKDAGMPGMMAALPGLLAAV